MIVLDTNVIFELVRRQPSPEVLAWLDQYSTDEIYLTAITTAELRYGVARLPDGLRKTELADELRRTIEEDFADRILPFNDAAAAHYGHLVAERETRGRPIGVADAQIAAICLDHDAILATRNTKDFSHLEVRIVNPWDSAPTA